MATTNSINFSLHTAFLPPHAETNKLRPPRLSVGASQVFRGRVHKTYCSLLFYFFSYFLEHVHSLLAKRDFEMSASNGIIATSEESQTNVTLPPPPPKQVSPNKNWVHFDEENTNDNKNAPAVINTENVQVNLERSLSGSVSVEGGSNVAVVEPKPLRNVELPIATVEPIRQGFSKWIVY